MTGFDVEGARKAGYTDAEITDHLGQQSKFDVAGARKAGYSDAEILGQLTAKPEKSIGSKIAQGVGNLVAGGVRGAGSIGATILAPVDIVSDALAGKGLSLESNRERRRAMDEALGMLGAETESGLYQTGKIAGEIAGTAGAGGAAANVATRAVPRLTTVAPNVLQAMRTSGMSANGAGMPVRALGGALSGGLSAGLANPEDVTTGATIGSLLPGAVKVAGTTGGKIGSVLRGPQQSDDLVRAVQAAREAGYVIPPTQAKPTLGNRLIEGMAGKLTTAQNASAKNQAVTNAKAAKAVGLADDAPLSIEALDGVRAEAGKAYASVANLGKVDVTGVKLPASVATETGNSPLLMGKTQSVDMQEVVRAWKQANSDATAYYRAYGRDANPETLAKAKAAADTAKQIDGFMEKQLSKMGKGDLLNDLKKARVQIAKTYSVESALNPVTGNVDARKLAKQLDKGKVLSGELLEAASFAGRFPKAAQAVEGMGSLPQTSPLDWSAGAGLSALIGDPMGLAVVGARPAARSLALSPMVQNRLANQGQSMPLRLLANPDLQQLGYRAAPLLGADQ